MPGFLSSLEAIGTGFGAGMNDIQRQNALAARSALDRMALIQYQRQLQEQQQRQGLYDQLSLATVFGAGAGMGQSQQQPMQLAPTAAPQAGPPTAGAALGGPQPNLSVPVTPSLAPIYQRESGGDYRAQNPKSSASGIGQDIDSTWREATGALGYGGQYAHAKDAPPAIQNAANIWLQGRYGNKPWAASAGQGAKYLPAAGQRAYADLAAQMPSEDLQQAQAVARDAASSIDPIATSQNRMAELAAAIDKTDAPGHVKWAAMVELAPLLRPDERMMMTYLLTQARLGQSEQRLSEQERHNREMEQLAAGRGERQGWTPIQLPGNKVGRMNVGTGEVQEIPEAAGATRMGGPGQTLPEELKYPEKWQGMPDKPPPGVREDVWDNTLVFARTHQMPALGFQPGMRTQIIQAYPAALHALGIPPSQAPDIAAAYAGERHGQIVGGGRAAQIGLGLREAEQLGPTVKQAAESIPATDFPKYNQFLNWLNTQSGDPNIVKFRGALNSFLQTYTRTVGGTMSLTDFRLQHAYTLLNDAMARGQINQAIDQLVYEMKVMGAAVPEAMRDIQQLGQPPAIRPPANIPQPPTSQAAPSGPAPPIARPETSQKIIRLDENGNEIP